MRRGADLNYKDKWRNLKKGRRKVDPYGGVVAAPVLDRADPISMIWTINPSFASSPARLRRRE